MATGGGRVLRSWRAILMRHALALLVLSVTAALAWATPALAGQTVVSLTFDDGRADNYVLKDMFAERGMKGTFYVNSGKAGTSSYYLTWAQIQDLAQGGNEIGGDTVNHVDLTSLNYDQQKAEVCNDRQALIGRGFNPVSFAYPFAKWNTSAKQVVQECGYSSAREVGNGAETIPPRDAYVLRTPPDSNDRSTLQRYVTDVENAGGGWVILVFHSIGSNGISEADMAAFLDWLQPRTANGTVVKTVGEAIGAGPPVPPNPTFMLNAQGYKVKGQQKVDLSWSGTDSPQVDVYRDGGKITTVTNSGAYTDHLNRRGGGSYRYKVCEAGTTTCSNEALVTF